MNAICTSPGFRWTSKWLVAPIVFGLLLSGCSSDGGAASDGSATTGSGVELTVPALWAGRNTDGTMVGGIELAQVRVGTEGEPGFSMDLTDVEARGAGPSWLAASTSAAAVATLYSGADPGAVDIHFTITGPIDGPSAGGILTVGLLAALRNVPLLPDVTMTGTISPDGSIGPISGTATKIESAAAAGYTTVLLPVRNMMSKATPNGPEEDMATFGATMGVTVRPVQNIAEAFESFTGTPFVPPATTQYSIAPEVATEGAGTAGALIARIDDGINDAPLPAKQRSSIASESDLARTALLQGDAATAYGLAADAYQRLANDLAEVQARTNLREGGLDSAKALLLASIDRTLAQAEALIVTSSDVSGLGLDQQLSMPAALGWVTYAEAVLKALKNSVGGGFDERELISAARVVAEQQAALDVFFPDAVAVVRAMPSRSGSGGNEAVAFISGYTNFLVRAGAANEAYLATVIGQPGAASDPQNALPGDLSLITHQLSLETALIPKDQQTVDLEIAQSARAITYFVVSSTAVSTLQSLGLFGGIGIGIDTIEAGDGVALAASINSGKITVDEFAAHLQEVGFDAGYAVWSATWGAAGAKALASGERSTKAAVQALNEIWYDTINVFMLNAAHTHR